MLLRWWQGLQIRRESAALARRAIPDDLWKRTLVRYPFLQRREAADATELRRLTSLFLDRKEFSCTGGLRLTDAMAVAVAAQAVLPILRLGLQRYDGFVGIVIHPNAVVAQRSEEDADGVVHEFEAELLGEAVHGGPVMLSWPHVRRAGHSAAQGLNVVIHEFVHVLDQGEGQPALPAGLPAPEWQQALAHEHQAFAACVEADEPTLLDPYGATSVAEFFPVASEIFFDNATKKKKEKPVLYGMLCRFYLQDPAADQPLTRQASKAA